MKTKRTRSKYRLVFKALSAIVLVAFIFTFVLTDLSYAMTSGASDSGTGGAKGLSQAGAAQAFQADLFTGRATHSIPIFVPPGRKGIQPSLGIGYSQGGPNTWLGKGWSFDAGFIQRSTKRGPPTYSDAPVDRDPFLISFQGVQSELIDVASPLSAVRELRIQDEGLFLKILYDGTSFTVFDKGGTQYTFGTTTATRIDITGKGTFRWMIDTVTDPFGNTIIYTYDSDPDHPQDPQKYLSEIHYTGPSPANHVEFILESTDRPDPVLSLQPGAPLLVAKRLKEIISYAGAQQARRYVLDYTVSARTSHSLLASVTEFGTDNVLSLPPVTFSYEEGTVGFDTKTNQDDTAFFDATWNVRASNRELPDISWSNTKTTTSGSFFGNRTFSSTGTGDLTVRGPGDSAFHSHIYLYSPQDGVGVTVSVSGEGDHTLHLNGEETTSALTLNKGYNLFEWIAHSNISFDVETHGFFGTKQEVVRTSTPVDQTLTFVTDLEAQGIRLLPTQFGAPRLAGDFNGDGITDLAFLETDPADPTKKHIKVSCANNFAFIPETVWLSGISGGAGPLIGDYNGDGKTDLGLLEFNQLSVALANDNLSFDAPFPVGPNLPAGSTPLVSDFNADGRFDIGSFDSPSGTWQVALSDDFPNFGPLTTWKSGFGENQSPLTGDFNGDGLTDIASVDYDSQSPDFGTWQVALSNGSGFETHSVWATGFAEVGCEPLVIDCSQNGKADIGCFNPETGEVLGRPSNGVDGFGPQVSWFTFPLTDPLLSFQPGDFNGDGLQDPAVFHQLQAPAQVAHSEGQISDLLIQIDNGRGGKTTIDYIPSTKTHGHADVLDPAEDLPTRLPFVTPVLHEVTTEDGLGNTYTMHYDFRGGLFQSETRDFLGYRLAKVTDAELNISRTFFHQEGSKDPGTGDWLYPLNPHPFKGRVEKTQNLDPSGLSLGGLYTESATDWKISESANLEAPLPFSGIRWVYVSAQKERVYDGDSTFRETMTRFSYDVFGNLERTIEYGETTSGSIEDFTNVTDVDSTDNRTSTNEYVSTPLTDETRYFHNLLQRTRIYPGAYVAGTALPAGDPLAERRFYYDQPGATSPTLSQDNLVTTGALTQEGEWLDTENRYIQTSITYDTFGNVLTITDPRGAITTNTYGVNGTFLVQIQNDLGQTRGFSYDARTGQELSTTDLNGQVTSKTYDTLGRLLTVISPLDSAAFPTMEYTHDFNIAVPGTSFTVNRVTAKRRIEHGQAATLESISFTDGLGRTVQSRSDAEDTSQQIVSGSVLFNSRGLVECEFLPYFEASSTSFVPPDATRVRIDHVYDCLGRRVKSIYPDATESEMIHDDWQTISMDPNGHATRSTQDAYGRLIQIEENYSPTDPAQAFVTGYTYNLLDNLVQTTDAQGNITSLSYDSFSRKISMNDPDMGVWNYAYDDNDNLLNQTDAKGQITSFVYDAINRVQTKSFSDGTPQVTYTYDDPTVSFAKGRVTHIADGSGTVDFVYDALGQVVSETKSVTGEGTHTFTRTYDGLGRIKALTYPDTSVLTYEYNAYGDVERMLLDGAPLIDNVDYNPSGQITKLVLGNGTETQYTYDPLTLRLASLKTAKPNYDPATAGPENLLQDLSYGFDAVGNVTSISDAINTATQSFAYDALDRLVFANGGYGTKAYQYDAVGNILQKGDLSLSYEGPQAHAVTQAVETSGKVTQYTYDANGNRVTQNVVDSELSTQYTYDAENRLIEVDETLPDADSFDYTLAPGWNYVSFPYLPSDRRISTVLSGAGLGTTVTQISRYNPATSDFEHWVNDPDFNDFSELEYGVGYGLFATQATTFSVNGQLPQADTPIDVVVGNNLIGFPRPASIPIEEAIGTRVQGVDYTDILHYDTVTQSFEACPPGFTCEPGKAYFYQSLTADLLQLSPSVTTTRFVYDGDGGRVQKVSENGTTTYLGKDVEVTSSLTTKYVFLGGQRIASSDSQGKILFYHGDHLGSSNALTDSSGELVSLSEYSPFGETSRQEGTEETAHKYTGQEEDKETHLYYYGARYFDPGVGRFITPDTYVQDPADPQTFNRYSYVQNNPVNLVDPTGNFSWGTFFTIFAAVALGAFTAGFALAAFGIAATSVGGFIIGGAITGFVAGGILGGIQSGLKGAITGALKGAAFGALGGGLAAIGAPFIIGGLIYGAVQSYRDQGWDGVAYFAAGVAGAVVGYGAGQSAGKSFRNSRVNTDPQQQTVPQSRKEAHQKKLEQEGLGNDPLRGDRTKVDTRPFGPKEIQVDKNSWRIRFNPFKGKSPAEIDRIFRNKGYEARGSDPISGKGGYVNPRSGRSYHIDPKNRFGEPPHVDVNRPRLYKGDLGKRKFNY